VRGIQAATKVQNREKSVLGKEDAPECRAVENCSPQARMSGGDQGILREKKGG